MTSIDHPQWSFTTHFMDDCNTTGTNNISTGSRPIAIPYYGLNHPEWAEMSQS